VLEAGKRFDIAVDVVASGRSVDHAASGGPERDASGRFVGHSGDSGFVHDDASAGRVAIDDDASARSEHPSEVIGFHDMPERVAPGGAARSLA
jgi:hypothetical protein